MSFRADVRTNLTSVLLSFQAANTSLLETSGMVYSARPPQLTDRRSVFVGGIDEPAINLAMGIWQREANVDVLVCVPLGANEETMDNLEALADALIDWLAANAQAHAIEPNTSLEPIRSQSVSIPDGGTDVPAVAITCRVSMLQGRT